MAVPVDLRHCFFPHVARLYTVQAVASPTNAPTHARSWQQPLHRTASPATTSAACSGPAAAIPTRICTPVSKGLKIPLASVRHSRPDTQRSQYQKRQQCTLPLSFPLATTIYIDAKSGLRRCANAKHCFRCLDRRQFEAAGWRNRAWRPTSCISTKRPQHAL